MSTKIGELLDMLSYMRPVDSDTEEAFTQRFVATLPGATCDKYGNWHVTMGESPILWSCHTDTVHDHAGRQTTHYDPLTGIIRLSKKSRRYASCLGADDTAGVWLMRQMVLRGVTGHYIFHYGEEVGGIGSNDIADHSPEVLDGSLFAIALDRKGKGDIVTRQFGTCCSDTFAKSLARELNKTGLRYAAAPGIYTDTANYTGIIGECTNLSVGYENAHTPQETLDAHFLLRLLDVLCAIDASQLVSERAPNDTRFVVSSKPWTFVNAGYAANDYTLPVTSRFSWEYCEWCGSQYCLDTSNAADFVRYCDRDCERYAMVHDAEWEVGTPLMNQSTYLDPHYADVVAALDCEPDH